MAYSKQNSSKYFRNSFDTNFILCKENTIGGTDFDPNGEFAATIDNDGICLISSLGTDTESYHMQMRMNNSSWCASGNQLTYNLFK